MSRVAGRLVLAALMGAASLTPSLAADRSARMNRDLSVAVDACRAPQVEVVRYQEQVCQKGVSGYASCRWVEREHEVQAAGNCEPSVTVERARPATRGMFPAGGARSNRG